MRILLPGAKISSGTHLALGNICVANLQHLAALYICAVLGRTYTFVWHLAAFFHLCGTWLHSWNLCSTHLAMSCTSGSQPAIC
mmetsp:Transcript_30353/g.78923  ORF Transcript_30353/g.78923 Transcript_30353/m.78923 type:complete len:83 (+) Transcript_30353:431-679(+)